MHFVYMDDSGDDQVAIYSALLIPADRWQESFGLIRDFRRNLKKTDGIYVRKELHAWKFVSGRGKPGVKQLSKSRRAEIFRETLTLTSKLPDIRIINACFPKSNDKFLFERLLNRINRTVKEWGSQALIICDEGKEAMYTRLARKMGVYNPIPSMFGAWESGEAVKNIPIEHVLEDLVFKNSRRSYLIQLADFCAYALLRRERPLESKSKYGIHQAFALLDGVLFRDANFKDPEGIIRP